MTDCRVAWTLAATGDLEAVAVRLAAESPIAGTRMLERLWSAAESLRSNPARGRLVPELLRFGVRTWRELIVVPYRIVYECQDDRVRVVDVLDGRRDLEELLLERLTRPE